MDVSDEALFAGGEALAKAIASLDENGFNTDGEIYSATVLRARTLLALVRDEILEIALGCNEAEDISELAGRLKTRSRETYAKFPLCIQYHPDIMLDKTLRGPTLYARTVTHLEHLENLFLLERLMIKHGGGNMQDLIDISCEMLDMTLVWWKHSNRFAGMHSDLEWLVTTYAAPTAGVLCIELLKQIHRDSRQANRSGSLETNNAPRYVIPRSQTIQNLTLFVGFLDWIQITEPPTTDICGRIRQIVSRVLDEILGGGGGGGGGGAPPDNRTAQMAPSQALEGGTQTTAMTAEEELQSATSFAQMDSLSTMFDFENADLWNFELMDTYGWIEA
ncbi:uncharacterized protein A1O9_03939 [Exophiala aquamarina CBS 119918]|uniref:Transcription factor domain-containing protein n=1 Tax=Exophiala aquamarina CBS 119918 TaxID=1182545 RepID=A0A072PU72_9EURO|nr:uncharacterized protein A1O9_03939 [Exophiala aquamarina CBS 119918]KEF59095.1 hypothetical protein A1O9_03939 [Exophiala aquamarina CBS 119918]